MNKLMIICGAAMLCAAPTLAGDNLEPEASVFGTVRHQEAEKRELHEWEDVFFSKFEDAFGYDVRLRVTELPSFTPETVTGIREQHPGQFRVFFRRVEIPLWHYLSVAGAKLDPVHYPDASRELAAWKARYPKDWRDIRVNRCEAPLDAKLAQRLIGVWRQMLLRTAYDPERYHDEGELVPPPPFDGTTWHFFVRFGYKTLAGETTELRPETTLGAVSEIITTMREYCEKGDAKFASKLADEVELLSIKLNK